MSTQLLIYEQAVSVSHARHGEWSVEIGTDYGFCRTVNSVPLTTVEFAPAAAEYAIVFAGNADLVMPAVILGLRNGENRYVTRDGGWQARYIPAFVRRYPFVFSSSDEGKTFTLCIDERFAGFNRKGDGERLFGTDRKPAPYLENVLKFLQQYQFEFQRTQTFCRKLKGLNLLEPMRAQVSLEGGERISLAGFSAVSPARLKTLAAETIADLVKSDELELIHTHLVSMRNFTRMRQRLLGAHTAAAA